MFRVERHVLCASHAAAVTHYEQQKAAAAGKKAAKARKKPKSKLDADPPPKPGPQPDNPEPEPGAKQAPQPKPKPAPEAAPMEVDAPAHPSAKPAGQLRAQTHDQALDGGETKAMPPPFGRTRQAPALRFRAATTSNDKGQRKVVHCTGKSEN